MNVFTLWHWLAFAAFVTGSMVLDLGVFHRRSRDTTVRDAGIATALWCGLALVFNGFVWWQGGADLAGDFLTGYLVEWSLSMDNVFVFYVIFNYFRVPAKYQYRVLFWGIIGAVVLRLAFILAGTWLIQKFHWALYVLGAFLIYTGIKLAVHDDEFDPETNWVVRISRRMFPVARESHGQQFFAREQGKLCITPLFLVLLVIDFVDVLFAIDSVPAILGITQDTFVVFTSNVFAILGLRALYFLLAGLVDMFRYLRYGLSAILVFVGAKMLLEPWAKNMPHWVPLLVVVSLLAISMLASVIASRRKGPPPPSKHDDGRGGLFPDQGPPTEGPPTEGPTTEGPTAEGPTAEEGDGHSQATSQPTAAPGE